MSKSVQEKPPATKKRNVVLATVVRVVVVVLLLGLGSFIFRALVEAKVLPSATAGADRAARLSVMRMRPVPVQRQWWGFGTVEPRRSTIVPARVTAVVIEVPDHVVEGASVEAGDLLVQLDAADFASRERIAAQSMAQVEAQIERLLREESGWKERVEIALDQVALAQADFDRVIEAQASGAAREREVDVARRLLNAARRDEVAAREEFEKVGPRRRQLLAQLESLGEERRQSQRDVARCTIRSPIGGVLESVDVEVGENVTSGHRIGRVVDLRQMEVPLRLPSASRRTIAVGDDVELRRANGRASWSTRVARINPEDDPSTRTMLVYVELEQDDGFTLALPAPGQFVEARVTSSKREPRWLVPRRSLDGERVLLIEDGRIVSRRVELDEAVEGRFPELGLPDDQWVALREGLPEGTLIVVSHSRSLADGMTVDPVVAGDPKSGGERKLEPADDVTDAAPRTTP